MSDSGRKIKALLICIGSLAALIMLQICLLYVYSMLWAVFGVDFRKNADLVAVYYMIYSVCGIIIFVLIYRRIDKQEIVYRPDYFLYKVKPLPDLFFAGVALQALAYGVVNLMYVLIPPNPVFDSYKETISNLNGSTTALIYFYTLLLAPILEEYVFRGLILETAKSAFSPLAANMIQALLFGLFHGNIIQGIYAFIIGIVIGFIKNKTGRMIYVIFLHIAINLSGVVMLPVIAYLLSGVFSLPAIYLIITLGGAMLLVVFLKRICYDITIQHHG